MLTRRMFWGVSRFPRHSVRGSKCSFRRGMVLPPQAISAVCHGIHALSRTSYVANSKNSNQHSAPLGNLPRHHHACLVVSRHPADLQFGASPDLYSDLLNLWRCSCSGGLALWHFFAFFIAQNMRHIRDSAPAANLQLNALPTCRWKEQNRASVRLPGSCVLNVPCSR